MRVNTLHLLVIILSATACLFSAVVMAKVDLSASGKQLYYKGIREKAGELTAYVGRAAIPMSATNLPCVGCHGRDGKGRPEGGVKPSDITWSQLSKSYGGTSKSGRQYGTYNEDSFLRAVSEGIDPAGNQLDPSMPRYNISRHDARRLISYLKNIENEYDPGVSDKAIVFASLQMQQGWQSKLGEIITSTIRAYFQDINQQGGVYGRKLQLKDIPYLDMPDFNRLVEETAVAEDVFASLGTLSGNADPVLVETSEKEQFLSIAPFTNEPAANGNQHRYSFYIYGGMETQIGALTRRIAEQANKQASILVLHQQSGPYEKHALQAERELQTAGFSHVQVLSYQSDRGELDSKSPVKKANATHVLFLGASHELLRLYPHLSKYGKIARIYLPGILVSRKIAELPEEVIGKMEFSYHATPDVEGNLEEFYQFLYRHKFGAQAMSTRLFAYSAARITVESLKRAGKRVSREKVIDALEQLFDFNAGLNRPVRFGSSRRVGLLGAYIVRFDTKQKRLISTGDWIALD